MQQVFVNGVSLESKLNCPQPLRETVSTVQRSTSVACSNMECNCAPYLRELTQEFADVFANDLPGKQAVRCKVEHRIDLQPGYTPPVKGLYRMSQTKLQELKTILDDLLHKDFIAKSSSPFAAPILFLSEKKTDLADCAPTFAPSTDSQSRTAIPSRESRISRTACITPKCSAVWTSPRDIGKSRYDQKTNTRRRSGADTDTTNGK